MQYRVGKCGSCGATFKVPASFQGEKAKCKACEKGVVHVGPVQGGEAPAKPAAKPAPAKAASGKLEEYVPSGKKRSGPSMMEKLRAERAAAEAAEAKPAPAKRAGRPSASGKPKANAGPRAGAKPSAGAGRPKSAGGSRSTVRAGAAKTTRRAGARGGAASRRGDDDDEGEGGRRGRRAPEKKKSPAPLIGGIVVVLVVAFGVWKFVLSDDEKPVQASDEQVAGGANPEETPSTDGPTGVEDPVSDETTGLEDPLADAGADPGEDTAADVPDEAAAPVEPGAPDLGPDLSDTNAYPRFGPPEGTSDEDWAKVQEYIETALDPMAGAKGNRALDKAIAMEKAGFAAIVNQMLDIDYTTEQGYRDGDIMQRALEKIANGKNAGWKYSTEEADVRFNRKAVVLLWKVWNRSKDDEAYWLKYTKQDKAAEDPVEEALSDDDLDDLDDLDGF